SAISATLPLPSHTESRQSCGACAATGVFAAVKETPHTPAVQVRAWHSSSVPWQSAGVSQPTHIPAASQTRLTPHAVPCGLSGFEGTPAVHTSSVQAFLSSGTSVSSACATAAPLPSHTSFWQSPAVCAGSGVPAAVKSCPHLFCAQVRVWQASSAPEQSAGARHSTQLPIPSHTALPIEQGLPEGAGLWTGTPASQTSSVQGFPSSTGAQAVPPVPPVVAPPAPPPVPPEPVVPPPSQPSEPARRPRNNRVIAKADFMVS